jgi:hypothetical protein
MARRHAGCRRDSDIARLRRRLSWLHQFRRPLVRFERRADIHEALLTIGCCLICFRKLQGSF